MLINAETLTFETNNQNERRIYVCESGSVCIEEKHFRRTLSPEEFIALLREIFRRTHGKKLNSQIFL